MTNNKQQTAVELMIAEIQRRVAIIQSEPQTMTRELMIENLGVDLDTYKEMEKEQTINFTDDWYFYGPLLGEGIDVKNTIEQHFNNTYGGGEQ